MEHLETKSESEIASAVKGKHIATVKGSKDEDALRVDLTLREGGTLTILLIRENDFGWRHLLERRPHEVCMGWDGPGGARFYCCDGDTDNPRSLNFAMEDSEIKSIGGRDGEFHLELSDGVWKPYIHWISRNAIDDRLKTLYRWGFTPQSKDATK